MEVCMAEINNSNNNMNSNNNGSFNKPPQNPNNMTEGQRFQNNPNFNAQQNLQFQQNPNMQGGNQRFAQNQRVNPQQYAQSQQNSGQNMSQQRPAQNQQGFTQNSPQQPLSNQSGLQGKKTLSEEDKERLRKVARDNLDIKKLKKRVKKPSITENARPLFKLRSLYSAKLAHRMYYERMLEIAKLRALANEGGKKGAALIGTAAKKTRSLVATLLIVFAILAVVGTGTFVTISMLNRETPNYDFTGVLTIVDQNKVEAKVDNYVFGSDVNVPISINNSTGQIIFISFYIDMKPNEYLQDALDRGELDFSKLVLSYKFGETFNPDNWLIQNVDGTTYMYYYGQVGINSQLTIIDGYSIDLAEGETNHEDWVKNGYGVELTFTINYYSVPSVQAEGLNSVPWPQEWKDVIKERIPNFK